MPDKTQLFVRLDQTRAETNTLLTQCDPDAVIYAGWTIKDIIGHLSAWEQAGVTSLQAHAEGSDAHLPTHLSEDDYNQLNVARRKNFPFEKIHLEWTETRDWLRQVLEEMPDEQFESEMTYPWGVRGSVTGLIDEIIQHEIEHRSDIIKYQEQQQ